MRVYQSLIEETTALAAVGSACAGTWRCRRKERMPSSRSSRALHDQVSSKARPKPKLQHATAVLFANASSTLLAGPFSKLLRNMGRQCFRIREKDKDLEPKSSAESPRFTHYTMTIGTQGSPGPGSCSLCFVTVQAWVQTILADFKGMLRSPQGMAPQE